MYAFCQLLQLCYSVEWSEMHVFFCALTLVFVQQEKHLTYKSTAAAIPKGFSSGHSLI